MSIRNVWIFGYFVLFCFVFLNDLLILSTIACPGAALGAEARHGYGGWGARALRKICKKKKGREKRERKKKGSQDSKERRRNRREKERGKRREKTWVPLIGLEIGGSFGAEPPQYFEYPLAPPPPPPQKSIYPYKSRLKKDLKLCIFSSSNAKFS